MEEVKKEQTLVRSFRVTDEVMGKIKGFQDELGVTQDGVLRMLVQSYELEQSKNSIPSRETEINNFQSKATELVEAFLHSLQLNADAETRIRAEVALQLESKDKTIVDLQQRLEANEKLLSLANSGHMEAENRAVAAENAKKDSDTKLKAAEEKATDKEEIAQMLASKLTEAEGKVAAYDALKASESDLRAKLAEAEQMIKDAKRDAAQALKDAKAEADQIIAELKKDMEIVQERAEDTVENVRIELTAEKDRQIAVAELNAEKALAALNKEHAEDLRALQTKVEKLQDERLELREQLADAKARLATQNKLPAKILNHAVENVQKTVEKANAAKEEKS